VLGESAEAFAAVIAEAGPRGLAILRRAGVQPE